MAEDVMIVLWCASIQRCTLLSVDIITAVILPTITKTNFNLLKNIHLFLEKFVLCKVCVIFVVMALILVTMKMIIYYFLVSCELFLLPITYELTDKMKTENKCYYKV